MAKHQSSPSILVRYKSLSIYIHLEVWILIITLFDRLLLVEIMGTIVLPVLPHMMPLADKQGSPDNRRAYICLWRSNR